MVRERLGDQHPVEWVIVMPGQPTCCERVRDADRRRAESTLFGLLFKVIRCDNLPSAFLIESSQAVAVESMTRLPGPAIDSPA